MVTKHSDIELEVAHTIRSAALSLGVGDWGDPTVHDDGTQPMMIDVIFHEVRIGLEVTSIVDETFAETTNAAEKAVGGLRQSAIDAGFGLVQIELLAGTRVNDVRSALMGAFHNDDPISAVLAVDGVFRVGVSPAREPDLQIGTWSGPGSAASIGGFSSELVAAFHANRRKLESDPTHQRHLAVVVRALRARDPSQTPAPTFDDKLDGLWVVRDLRSTSGPLVWHTSGDGEWQTTRYWGT